MKREEALSAKTVTVNDELVGEICKKDFQKKEIGLHSDDSFSDVPFEKNLRRHQKQIPYMPGTKEYVKMYKVQEDMDSYCMISEHFSTLEEAEHFRDCFDDCYMASSEVVKNSADDYVVKAESVAKFVIVSTYDEDEQAFICASWS